MVVARSSAEMPEPTPSRASIDTVYAVCRGALLWATMGGSCRWSASASGIARQMTPPV